jgi:HEAT repeat protein
MEQETLLAQLKRLAASIDPDVRRQALRRLKSEVSVECEGAFELLESFSYDPKADIRAEAVRGFVAFPDRREIVWRGLTLGEIDPSTEVRAAAIEAAFVASDPELEFPLISLGQMFRTHSDRELRLAVAAGMSMFNCGRVLEDNLAATVFILLVSDRDPEVRRRMAAGGAVLFNYPYLEEIFIQAAETDDDAGVRAAAVESMGAFLLAEEIIAYARARLAADPTEQMHWAALAIAKSNLDQRCGCLLLGYLMECEHEPVAVAARASRA